MDDMEVAMRRAVVRILEARKKKTQASPSPRRRTNRKHNDHDEDDEDDDAVIDYICGILADDDLVGDAIAHASDPKSFGSYPELVSILEPILVESGVASTMDDAAAVCNQLAKASRTSKTSNNPDNANANANATGSLTSSQTRALHPEDASITNMLRETLRIGDADARGRGGNLSEKIATLRHIALGEDANAHGKDGVRDATLEDILTRICDGDVSTAALWITENDVHRHQMQQEEKDRAKKIVFERYGFRPVSQNLGKSPVVLDGKGTNKVRYHNNEVVTSRGEKYVATASKSDEWDGGSRGKVITKGKRGKGYT